jgi:hypothetical protein
MYMFYKYANKEPKLVEIPEESQSLFALDRYLANLLDELIKMELNPSLLYIINTKPDNDEESERLVENYGFNYL